MMLSKAPTPLPIISTMTAICPRPITFNERYIAHRPAPYSLVDSSQRPSSCGGVLCGGQAVWLEDIILRDRLGNHVRAFVEGIGLVIVDPRLIKRADGAVLLA